MERQVKDTAIGEIKDARKGEVKHVVAKRNGRFGLHSTAKILNRIALLELRPHSCIISSDGYRPPRI